MTAYTGKEAEEEFKRISTNNGIDSSVVELWEPGSTFIIHKKNETDIFEHLPKEITIVEIIEVYEDYEHDILKYLNKKFDIICDNGNVYRMESSLMPNIEGYEIYKNWAMYFSIIFENVHRKKKKIEKLNAYIEKFTKFQRVFKEKNPEKLI